MTVAPLAPIIFPVPPSILDDNIHRDGSKTGVITVLASETERYESKQTETIGNEWLR
jgi:hypothetical protein